MTYLEKARELEPGFSDRQIVYTDCPCYMRLEKESNCKLVDSDCVKCWNREIKNKIEEETKL